MVGEPRACGAACRSRASRWRSRWASRCSRRAAERPFESVVVVLAGPDAKPALVATAERGSRFLTVKAVGRRRDRARPLARALDAAGRPAAAIARPRPGVRDRPRGAARAGGRRAAGHPGARRQPRTGRRLDHRARRPGRCSTPVASSGSTDAAPGLASRPQKAKGRTHRARPLRYPSLAWGSGRRGKRCASDLLLHRRPDVRGRLHRCCIAAVSFAHAVDDDRHPVARRMRLPPGRRPARHWRRGRRSHPNPTSPAGPTDRA